MFEYFIAKRYLRSKRKMNFITIISILSTLGITIGVAALIIVLSVFNGFGTLVTSIMVSFDPHIRITATDERAPQEFDKIDSLLTNIPEVKSFYPFVEGKAVFLNGRSFEILNLKGITQHNKGESWGVSDKIISGDSLLAGDNIILGLPIALRLSARVGDTILVTSAYNIEKTITSLSIPKTKRFTVSGIFESNNRDYDVNYAFTSLEAGQRLFGMGSRITGYEIRLNDISESEKVKSEIAAAVNPESFSVDTWYDLHKDLYNVMLIERWSAYIILCLIIAVATFNILASLTMTVIEKQKDIGVMRTMGVSSRSVQRIFMYEGILVGIIGTLLGIGIGLLVCYLQIKYNFYPLDPSKYIIDALPVQVRVSDIFAIGAMALLLAFVAALYPARRAARTSIIQSIKYE